MTAAPLPPPRRHTLDEYLEFEESVPTKHEFHDGEILAMSGASPEHALINVNLISAVRSQLSGKPRRLYSSDLKIGIPPKGRVLYPDAAIVCGPLEFHPADPKNRIVTNPRVLFEILSPSTALYDRSEKFRQYRAIPSLAEYVLVSQVAPLVETFVRQPDGSWLIAEAFEGLAATATVRALQIEIPLSEIYADVTFPPPIPPPDPKERETI